MPGNLSRWRRRMGYVIQEGGLFPHLRVELNIRYRSELVERAPNALKAVLKLQGKISAGQMAGLNAAVKLEGRPEAEVAADYLQRALKLRSDIRAQTRGERMLRTTYEHLLLVAVLSLAIVVALPLGVLAAKFARLGKPILGLVSIVQTIPSLALFVFMILLLGIGAAPAMAALFLYSLLLIVRNTYTGLTDVAPTVRESAEVMGMSAGARLWWIELLLSARDILAGIKTAAVINVGTATLAALVGAGGYAQPILTGIRLDNLGLILEGAVPAAILALLVQGLFELGERWMLPSALRRG